MFVVIEGPNGAGKTTLINDLSSKGYTTLSSPNGTPLAKILRPACRGTDPWEDIDKKVQFLLFSAARLDEYIRCIENKEEVVVVDRWWTSTYVYQCILGGIDVGFMENTVHDNEKIDLVVLLDGDDDVLINRMESERAKNPNHKKCSWTKDQEIIKKLINIYRNELPRYLESKGIDVIQVNTTNMTTDQVSTYIESVIESKRSAKNE